MMKVILPLIFILLISDTSWGQKMPGDHFDEGIVYVEKEDYKNAIASFKYIVDNHQKNDLYPLAIYNLAYIYALDEDYDNAIKVYEKILASDFNEKDMIGGSIMDNPYANYKYKASRGLSEIYTVKKDYQKALEYLSMSDTKYPYLHFCGNEGCSNEFSLAFNYASLYQKLGQKDKALEKALKYSFRNNNNEILEILRSLLSEKKDVRKKLDKAIENISGKNNRDAIEYYITFFDTEIFVLGEYGKKRMTKSEIISSIKQSDFYKMTEKL